MAIIKTQGKQRRLKTRKHLGSEHKAEHHEFLRKYNGLTSTRIPILSLYYRFYLDEVPHFLDFLIQPLYHCFVHNVIPSITNGIV